MPGTAPARVVAALLLTGLDNAAELELLDAGELLAAAELVAGLLLVVGRAGVDTPVSEAVPPTVLHAASTTAIAVSPAARTLGRMWDILPFCQSARSSARGITSPPARTRGNDALSSGLDSGILKARHDLFRTSRVGYRRHRRDRESGRS